MTLIEEIRGKKLLDEGVVVSEGILSPQAISFAKGAIQEAIKHCADDIGCSEEEYLSVVSRWADPSPVTSPLLEKLLPEISLAAAAVCGERAYPVKANVICKNAHCSGAIPFHQDISYSPHSPYPFSVWIALDDVLEESGPLEVVPRSHLHGIAPPVDFWAPGFIPDPSVEKEAVKLPVSAGDGIFFDARLWHGSHSSQNAKERYALVIRFQTDNWECKEVIPPKEPQFFGMWTCGQETDRLLQEGARVYLGNPSASFVEQIERWRTHLLNDGVPFACDASASERALMRVKILHLAAERHAGGDSTGTVYKNLWDAFLSSLSEALKKGV